MIVEKKEFPKITFSFPAIYNGEHISPYETLMIHWLTTKPELYESFLKQVWLKTSLEFEPKDGIHALRIIKCENGLPNYVNLMGYFNKQASIAFRIKEFGIFHMIYKFKFPGDKTHHTDSTVEKCFFTSRLEELLNIFGEFKLVKEGSFISYNLGLTITQERFERYTQSALESSLLKIKP